jgi:hypothetical protein
MPIVFHRSQNLEPLVGLLPSYTGNPSVEDWASICAVGARIMRKGHQGGNVLPQCARELVGTLLVYRGDRVSLF